MTPTPSNQGAKRASECVHVHVHSHTHTHTSSATRRGQIAVINIALQQQRRVRARQRICSRICIGTNGRRSVRAGLGCARDSQLGGVLGNALGQGVQPSVAAAHHAVGAGADVGTAGRREATVFLHT